MQFCYHIGNDSLGKYQRNRIEIGHNEIGDADAFEPKLPEDIAAAYRQGREVG